MTKSESLSIVKHFSNLSDPRRDNKRHKLIDIMMIAICGVICNADSFAHIAEFGRTKYEWLKNFLELPYGIPSADTFERVFSLKGNQSNLHNDVKLFFQTLKEVVSFDYHETIDGAHGKIEIRKYWTTSDIDWLQGKENWKNMETICMVERKRQFDNKTVSETNYYMGSIESNAAHTVRSHWAIENITFIGFWMYHSVKMRAE